MLHCHLSIPDYHKVRFSSINYLTIRIAIFALRYRLVRNRQTSGREVNYACGDVVALCRCTTTMGGDLHRTGTNMYSTMQNNYAYGQRPHSYTTKVTFVHLGLN